MRTPNKRSRSKSNRPKPIGNIVNRVFDSSGPEGKVRGTPQQIIDKYQTLSRDAQLSGDRVASENFLQHAEHYTRMLNEAQAELAREAEARREQQQGAQQQGGQQQGGQQQGGQHRSSHGDHNGRQNPPRDDQQHAHSAQGHRRDDEQGGARGSDNHHSAPGGRPEPSRSGGRRPEGDAVHRGGTAEAVSGKPVGAAVMDDAQEPNAHEGSGLVETPEDRRDDAPSPQRTSEPNAATEAPAATEGGAPSGEEAPPKRRRTTTRGPRASSTTSSTAAPRAPRKPRAKAASEKPEDGTQDTSSATG